MTSSPNSTVKFNLQSAMGLITCATEDFYPVNWHRCGQSSKFLQTKPWVVQIFRMFSLGSVFCSLKMTVFSIEHGIFVQRFPHWPFFPSKSRSTSSRQWTKLNRLWWCPTLGDLRTFTLKSWDFNGFHSFGMLEIPLLFFGHLDG